MEGIIRRLEMSFVALKTYCAPKEVYKLQICAKYFGALGCEGESGFSSRFCFPLQSTREICVQQLMPLACFGPGTRRGEAPEEDLIDCCPQLARAGVRPNLPYAGAKAGKSDALNLIRKGPSTF